MSITCEEVMQMPRIDGTGSMSRVASNGRGLGVCNGENFVRSGRGLGVGYKRGVVNFSANSIVSKTQNESLQEQKRLENMLNSRDTKPII